VAEIEWNIAKAGPHCCLCNSGFAVDAPYFSALLQEPSGLTRKDYCGNCFQTQRPAEVFYFWKTQVPAEDPEARKAWKQRPVVDIDYVFDFFKRLEGEAGPQKVAFRYILALMLTRKKILVSDSRTSLPDGSSAQIFAEKRGGQKHTVVEPSLSEDEISSVSAELGVLLGLKPPPSPAQADAPKTEAAVSTEVAVSANDAVSEQAGEGATSSTKGEAE
jgi:hypothetical protein